MHNDSFILDSLLLSRGTQSGADCPCHSSKTCQALIYRGDVLATSSQTPSLGTCALSLEKAGVLGPGWLTMVLVSGNLEVKRGSQLP